MISNNRANSFSGVAHFVLNDDILDIDQINYNIIDYTTPNHSLGMIEIRNAGETGAIPGDIVKEQSTPLRFILDEELKVLMSLYKLQKNNSESKVKDMFIIQIMNNKHKFIAEGVYDKCFIGNISPIQYSTTTEETTIYVDVTLNYLTFNLKQIN